MEPQRLSQAIYRAHKSQIPSLGSHAPRPLHASRRAAVAIQDGGTEDSGCLDFPSAD